MGAKTGCGCVAGILFAFATVGIATAQPASPGRVERSISALRSVDSERALATATTTLSDCLRAITDPALRAQLLFSLGAALQNAGDYVRAEHAYKGAAAELEGQPPVDTERLAAVLYSLTNLYGETDRPQLAEKCLRAAMRLEVTTHPPGLIWLLHTQSHLFQSQERYKEAEAASRRAVELAEKQAGLPQADVGVLLSGLARSLARQQRFDEALVLYHRTQGLLAGSSPGFAGVARRMDISILEIEYLSRDYQTAEPDSQALHSAPTTRTPRMWSGYARRSSSGSIGKRKRRLPISVTAISRTASVYGPWMSSS